MKFTVIFYLGEALSYNYISLSILDISLKPNPPHILTINEVFDFFFGFNFDIFEIFSDF